MPKTFDKAYAENEVVYNEAFNGSLASTLMETELNPSGSI